MSDDEIDEIVSWQMTGLDRKQAPVAREIRNADRCPYCTHGWHGIPNSICKGSFRLDDTPKSPPNNSGQGD